MSQNRSTAVMQRRAPVDAAVLPQRLPVDAAVLPQRHVAPDALDYFPTPPWVARALCEFLKEQGEPLGALSCWEPACGEMHMARPLGEYFSEVRATDVYRYAPDHGICDFISPFAEWSPVAWVITNPPFLLAEQFIVRAREIAKRGVAMLVRTAFLEGEKRGALFAKHPPTFVLPFAERVVMLRGRLVRAGAADPFSDDGTGKPRKASTATSYCWIVWIDGQADTRLRWIGKSRRRLEREGDYPGYAPPADGDGGLL